MQNNPQQLSWQAIQAIVGVKLPSTVLRFDDIGLHLCGALDDDSDVEIIENDWESEENASPPSGHSDDERRQSTSPEPERARSAGSASPEQATSPPPTRQIEPDNNNGHKFECPSCATEFSSKSALADHAARMHTTPEETDPVDTAMSIENYLEVTLSTDSEASHACDEPILSGEQPLMKPTDDKRYPCHMCAEKFPSYWELRKHINSHFPGMLDSKSSFCHLCQKDYTKTGFMNHLRKHTGERPFVCELCHKAFSQSSSLSIHMKFHLNVRKHACTLCEKKFVTKSELSRHMTVHTKQKSYYCGVCDKAFTRSDNMKKHEKTHG